MCIAILKTKKGTITDEELRNCFNSNPDGAGIAYTLNNELKIIKGMFNVKDFIETVRMAEKICDNNMLIHCRIGTSGTKDGFNTHPFEVNKNVALIHNGILDIDVPKDSKKNDTQIFIDKYLKGFSTGALLHNETLHKLIKDMIGNNNKFVLMDNRGYYKIINEKAGHWKNNVWFSNDSYKTKTYYSYGWDYDTRGEWTWDNGDWKWIEKGNVLDEYKVYAIEDAIFNLTDEEILDIKETPIYVEETGEIISLENYETLGYDEMECDFLESISEDLYDKYMDLYEETLYLYNQQEKEVA